jgi:hypothetical protein
MPTFGADELFAVKFEPISPRADEFAECHFCYVVGGREVGNYELQATLGDVLHELTSILGGRNLRRNDQLASLQGAEIVRTLRARFKDDFSVNPTAVGDQWGVHVLTYSMDHGYQPGHYRTWSVYLVEGSDFGRVICVDDDDGSKAIIDERTPIGYVDNVLLSAWAVMVEHEERGGR